MNVQTTRTQKQTLLSRLETLYADMEEQYNQVARDIGLDCRDCQDNCCLSFFQHHTYIEWAYLWQGLEKIPAESRDVYLQKARDYTEQKDELLKKGRTPEIMCPLNDQGFCGMYQYRLMICRFHGVPNRVTMPDTSVRTFPGCVRCAKRVQTRSKVPVLDRTRSYIRLAEIERTLRGCSQKVLPKVDLTLAEMLVLGPPAL